MGSETSPPRLPTIDFSSMDLNQQGSAKWDSVKDQVKQALEEYGCFEALFLKVSIDLSKALFRGIQEMFDLPLETKLKHSTNQLFHGYIGQYPNAPLYESMYVDAATTHGKAQAFIDVLWPQGNPNVSSTLESYAQRLCELDQIIRRMVLESLGIEKYMDEHLDSTDYSIRVMKYESPKTTTEQKIGIQVHTDKNMLTLLHQNQVNGLEVQTKDGQWIKVQYSSPNSFVAFIGDSLYAWTNGRLHWPHHRVMMAGNEDRYSVGLFSTPKSEYIIKAPEELVDEEHPLLFKPFSYQEFLGFYFSMAGKRAACTLTNYCGI